MSDKMTLLTVKQTQHVLGAVTFAGTSEPQPEELVGDGLLVRGFVDSGVVGDEQFKVPADELETKVVDVEAAVFLQPREYIVVDEAAATPNLSLATANTSLSSTDVKVEAANNVSEDTKVWVQIDGGGLATPIVVKGSIPAGTKTCTLPIETLASGDYFLLALVAGHSMLVKTESVP